MTPEQKEHIQYLLARFLNSTITTKEEAQLYQYIDNEKDNLAWQEILEEFMATEQEIIINRQEYQPILNAILKKKSRLITMKPWMKWIAAASVIIIASLIVVISKRSEKSPPQVAITHDVPAPANTRAVITLADGSKVYLDSAGNGTIAQQNNINVVKNSDGSIIYSHKDAKTQSITAYNTMFNPRGSKVISLTLSDGTRVWLNSESSLKYPVAFNGNTREVEITGEAYFDVKHNSKQPFKVHLPNGSVIEDIGTSFNVNAYTDEQDIKTTLVEGSVKITNTISDPSASSVTLRPGEQSTQNTSNRVIRVQKNVDLEEVTAWKNGRFYYDGANIKTIMKEITRWYDVDVEYKDNINYSFVAKISRDVPVSELLKILELTDLVHFKIEGKRITVMK